MAALSLSLLFVLSLISTVRGYLHIYPPVDENDTRTPLYFALLQSFGGQYIMVRVCCRTASGAGQNQQ